MCIIAPKSATTGGVPVSGAGALPTLRAAGAAQRRGSHSTYTSVTTARQMVAGTITMTTPSIRAPFPR